MDRTARLGVAGGAGLRIVAQRQVTLTGAQAQFFTEDQIVG